MSLIVVGDRIKNTKHNSVGIDEFYGPYEADETTNRSALQVAEDTLTSVHKMVSGQTVGIKLSDGKVKDYQVQPKGTTPETYGLVEKGAGTTDYNDLDNKPTIGDGTNTALPIVGNIKVSANTASGSTAGVTVTQGQNAGEIEVQFTLPKGDKGENGADGQNGAPGENAVNPFKGWYGSISDLEAAYTTASDGDYAYAYDNTDEKHYLYKWNIAASPSAAWEQATDANDDPIEISPNTAAFKTGEILANINITDDLDDSDNGDIPNVEAVQSLALVIESVIGRNDKTLNLSKFERHSMHVLSSQDKWYANEGSTHIYIPVEIGQEYTILAHATNTSRYILAKSYSTPVANASIDKCEGKTLTNILAGQTATFVVPDDGHYIIINTSEGSTDCVPQSVTLKGTSGRLNHVEEKVDEIDESIQEKLTTDKTSNLSDGYITTNGDIGTTVSTTPTSDSDYYKYIIIQVSTGDTLKITGSGFNAGRLWAFTDSEYKLVSQAAAGVSKTTETQFTASQDGYFIFNSYATFNTDQHPTVKHTYKSGRDVMDIAKQLEEDVDDLDERVTELESNVDTERTVWEQPTIFKLGYVNETTGIITKNPHNGFRMYLWKPVRGGFEIELKSNWYLRAITTYDKYGNFKSWTTEGCGSSTAGQKVTIGNGYSDGNCYRIDCQKTDAIASESDYPLESITFAKDKVDIGADSTTLLQTNRLGELDLTFDLSNVMTDFPAQSTYNNNLSNLYTAWDNLVTLYGGTKVDTNASGEASNITVPSYASDYHIQMYKFLSKQARDDRDYARHIKVLVYAGEHVNEWLSMNLLLGFMTWVLRDWKTDHNAELLRTMVDWYVIPCLNTWGCNVTPARCNYNKVNLNRNFAVSNWKSGEYVDSYTNNYGGTSKASEYETKIIQYYIGQIAPDIFMDMHTGGTNAAGIIGTMEMSIDDVKYDRKDFLRLMSTICRTSTSIFIKARSENYTDFPDSPSTPLIDINPQYRTSIENLGTSAAYTGLSHQYAMEQGVPFSVLIENNMQTEYENGAYVTPVGDTHHGSSASSSAVHARCNLLFFTNMMMRLVKAASVMPLTHKSDK